MDGHQTSDTHQRRRHEAPEVGAMVMRMLRALVRRAAEGDLEAIEQLRRIELEAGDYLGQAAARAHQEADYSWTEIGRALGMTRQAARQRFGRAL